MKNPPLYLVSVAGPKMYELNSNVWGDVIGKNSQFYEIITVEGNCIYFDVYAVSGILFDSFRLEKDQDGVKVIEHPLNEDFTD